MLRPTEPGLFLARRAPLALVVFTAGLVRAGGEDVTFRTVALSGMAAPGTEPGATFASFLNPRIAADGRAVFYANLVGPGVNPPFNATGIWSERTGPLQLVVRDGEPAPGTEGAQFIFLVSLAQGQGAPGVDADGHVFFSSRLFGGDVCDCNGNGVLDNATGFWTDRTGELTKIARANDPAPGFDEGVTFDTLGGEPDVSPASVFGMNLSIKGPGITFNNAFPLYTDGSGMLAVAVQAGTPSPLPGLDFAGASMVGFDPTGQQLSFTATLSGPNVNQQNDTSLWHLRDGEHIFVIREGDPAPEIPFNVIGFGPSVLGSPFKNLSTRGGDAVAFTSPLNTNGTITGEALYLHFQDQLFLLAQTDTQAPGLPAGVQFDFFGFFIQNGPLGLNSAGQVAFFAFLTGAGTTFANRDSLWLADVNGNVIPLARSGDAPPDAGPEVLFGAGGNPFVSTFEAPAINELGQVAFKAKLDGPGPDSFANTGLYVFDPLSALRKIVQFGDLFDVAGDGSDLREISAISFNGDLVVFNGYNGPVFTDAGTLIFGLSFADGTSGVFTATVNPVEVAVELVSANPPLDNPFVPGVQPFIDVLDTGNGAALAHGIGGLTTPVEDSINYGQVQVTFNSAPLPAPATDNVSVTCAGAGAFACPSVLDVTGLGAGPYLITLSGVIPPGGCTTLAFAGTQPDESLQYQSLPGDVSMNGVVNTQDLLSAVQALNNGAAALPANLPRFDVNRSGSVNTQDLLRLVQLLNGANTVQSFNGVAVTPCP